MKIKDSFELISTDDKIGSFKLIELLFDNTLVQICLFAVNFFFAWILNGSKIGGLFGLIGIAFLVLGLVITEVALTCIAGIAEISAEIIADCIAPRAEGLGTTTHPTRAPKKDKKPKIQFTKTTIRNLIGAWTLRPKPVTRSDDYLCLGISTNIRGYATEQLIRDVHVYEAEIEMLWFINMHLLLLEHENVLGRGKFFVRRAIRWMYKDFSDEMRPFLNDDMEARFQIFRRDVDKQLDQRVAKNQPLKANADCCVDIFQKRFNRSKNPETTNCLLDCILKTLEYADAL